MEGRTDRHDEVNNRFAQFYECAKKVRKVNSRNSNLALRLLLFSMLLAPWGHYRKMVESYFVCQIVIKGNSCDSETRAGVKYMREPQSTPSILVRAGVVWTDPRYTESTRLRTFLLEHRADTRRGARHVSERTVRKLTTVFPRKYTRRQYPLGVARATCWAYAEIHWIFIAFSRLTFQIVCVS